MIKKLLIAILVANTAFAQTPSPTPDPEEQMATSLNISKFELRASKAVQVLQQLIALKRSEREGTVGVISNLTNAQRQEIRARRLEIRSELGALCDAIGAVE